MALVTILWRRCSVYTLAISEWIYAALVLYIRHFWLMFMSQKCRMLVFSVTSLSFFENVWTSTNLGTYVILSDNNSLWCIPRSWNHLHFNLCHLRMTPLRTIPQQVNDTPYTTPAKKGPKIAPRVYCRVLIFSGPLLRTSLNDSLQIVEKPFCR